MPSKTPEPVVPEVRKGQGDMHISADVFRERLRERFHDPAFERASAEIVLSESRARPGAGLDGRDLSPVGGRSRGDDRHAGLLVSGTEHAEADDRPAGVRRRRQSRSDFDRGQGSGESQGAGAARLALAMQPGRRRCDARSAIGSRTWISSQPGRSRISIGTSATTSPMQRATMRSTKMVRSTKKCATRRAR